MANVDLPPRLSQLMADTVLRVNPEETSSAVNNLVTILPLQHRGFWETAETKHAVSMLESDIRDQLQQLRVESSGEHISSLASGLSHAAASSLDKHAETYISDLSSRLAGDIPKVSASGQ